MFGFVKKVFFTGLTILSNFTDVNPLSVVFQGIIKSVKQDHKLLMLMEMSLFFPFSIKTSKCSGVAIISIIRMQKFVFLILRKT